MDNYHYRAGTDTASAPWNDSGPRCPECDRSTEDEPEREDGLCAECGADADDMAAERHAAELERKWEGEDEDRWMEERWRSR